MRRATQLLGILLCAALGACASAPAQPVASVSPESASAACTGAPVLRPGDVAAVSPLWAANKLVKSPSYQLAGVIVELRPGPTPADLQAAIQCRSACAPGEPDLLNLPGLRASVDTRSEHLAMILRSDDPATAREAMHRAELLLRR